MSVLNDSVWHRHAFANRLQSALLLLSMGRHGQAREQLQGLLRRAEVQPKYYRREQADWLSQARQALRSLDGN